MQERLPSGSRNPTARSNAPRSAHNERTAAPLSAPGLIVTIRKIAARVSGAVTGWGVGLELSAAAGMVIGSDSVRWCRRGGANNTQAAAATTALAMDYGL